MDNQREGLLLEFSGRIQRLVELCDTLMKERGQLARQLEVKEAEVRELRSQISELEREYNSLKTAKIIRIDPEEMKQAKARVQKMVYEIDKCVRLLKE